MNYISQISQKAIENIQKSQQELTPEIYGTEFCKISKTMNLSTKECDYFQKALSILEQQEIQNTMQKEPKSIYDVVDILLNRLSSKNIQNMSKMLQKSMTPSISLSIGDDLQSFCIKIGDSPSLIFEESIQYEMEKFIQNRFQVDQKILAKKTADIAKLISLMNQYLGDAIESTSDGSKNVSTIKNEIQSFRPENSSHEEFSKLQVKLIEAASTIENEMTNVNKTFESGQNEVLVLEKKVESLENELKKVHETSMLDHLTGTLNRRSLEDALTKAEERFVKNQENFAIVFFGIDYFKNINDSYGHDTGDIILKIFAALLLKLTKDSDIIARYGGEEFIGLLRYTEEKELYKYIERIKSVVTKNKFIHKEHKIQIKFSAGVQVRSKSKSALDSITQADALLYKAKNTGRNKIIFWNDKEI